MAVQGNSSDVIITKGFRTIYGIAPFKVVAINPNMDQLVELGVNAQKEPEYLGDKSRIDIWMQTVLPVKKTEGVDKSLEELGLDKQMNHKLTIFISDSVRGKADGSTSVWINNFGRISSAAAGEKPTASWWKNNGEHQAREGEIELIQFIRAWVNAGPSDEVYIDDWAALIRGNVKELRDILSTFKNNIVRSSIEVRVTNEGKAFAGIYVKHHEPWNITGTAGWTKAYAAEGRKNVYLTYQLEEFVPPKPSVQPDIDVPASSASEWPS